MRKLPLRYRNRRLRGLSRDQLRAADQRFQSAVKDLCQQLRDLP